MTGIRQPNIQGITKLLHKYGALSFWDYAASAPYVNIDMNPKEDPACAKDAAFISPHKFLGGPGTPGLLVVKKAIVAKFSQDVPSVPGPSLQEIKHLINLSIRVSGYN